jgi:hypothetical protein
MESPVETLGRKTSEDTLERLTAMELAIDYEVRFLCTFSFCYCSLSTKYLHLDIYWRATRE